MVIWLPLMPLQEFLRQRSWWRDREQERLGRAHDDAASRFMQSVNRRNDALGAAIQAHDKQHRIACYGKEW